MKRLCILITMSFYYLFSFAQKIEFQDFNLRENLPDWINFSLERIKNDRVLIIDRTLNPFYLESDFNGDGILDIAMFVIDKQSKKKGVLIIHGNSFDKFLLGAGQKFGNGGDDFSWMDVWKIYRKSTAEETIFNKDFDIEGSKTIQIKNTAISVSSSEGASNLILWKDGKYCWIHTGD